MFAKHFEEMFICSKCGGGRLRPKVLFDRLMVFRQVKVVHETPLLFINIQKQRLWTLSMGSYQGDHALLTY